MLAFGVCAAAQDNSPQGPAPAPAFGQSAPVLNPDNPPISGLDEPGLKMKVASRSFISPAIQVGETADTDENNRLGTYQVEPVSHVLGALDLQKFWPKSDLILEYLGGGAFETSPKYEVKQLEALGFEGVTRWRTGYLELRDSFSYVPDGAFDAQTGEGLPGLGIALGGIGTGEAGGGLPGTHAFGTGAFEAVGDIPRLANTAIADVVQAISPRSAVTLVGSYSNAHFSQDCSSANPQNCCPPGIPPSQASCLINSDQTTVEGGYSHMLSRHDQIAGVYAFQLFRFPYNTGGEIYNSVFNLRWSHSITGRMRFVAGAGPQYTDLRYGFSTPSWSLSGRAILTYAFEHATFAASWEKYTSQGSGLYAGADTQQARLAFRRPLGRTYLIMADLGYTRNQRLQGSVVGNLNNDNEGIAGVILRKHLGRTYDILGAYTFNEVAFDISGDTACTAGISNTIGCGTREQRQRVTFGMEWHPRATRIE